MGDDSRGIVMIPGLSSNFRQNTRIRETPQSPGSEAEHSRSKALGESGFCTVAGHATCRFGTEKPPLPEGLVLRLVHLPELPAGYGRSVGPQPIEKRLVVKAT
jgi:hypothetical protein